MKGIEGGFGEGGGHRIIKGGIIGWGGRKQKEGWEDMWGNFIVCTTHLVISQFVWNCLDKGGNQEY